MLNEATVKIRVPKSVLQFGFDQESIQQQVKEWLVLSLFTDEKVSSGKAARLLGIHRFEFLALLRKRGIAYVNYTEDELADEFTAVQQFTPIASQ